MNQQLTLQKEEEKTVSVLSKTRNSIFYYRYHPDSDKTYTNISYLRKNNYIQGKVKFDNKDLQYVLSQFKKWSSIPTYLTFKSGDGTLLYGLAAKRGNQVYEYYVTKKLTDSISFMNKKTFSKLILRDKKGHRTEKYSNIMFISLTTNPKVYNNSIVQAWLQIEKYYNIFTTRLRKKYGKCWIMKANESHLNGFPHIHLLVITEKPFTVFPRKNKKGFSEYRTHDKSLLASYWNSYIDVSIPNLYGIKQGHGVDAIKDYIFKDMLKSYIHRSSKTHANSLSLAMGWIFGKRCYSVSKKDFVFDLITDTSITQTQIEDILEKEKDETYEFIGLTDFDWRVTNHPPPILFKIKPNEKNYQKFLDSVYGAPKKKTLVKTKPKDLNSIKSYY